MLRDDADLSPAAFAEFLAAQRDLSPKAWPRYVWIAADLPSTATNKILKRELIALGAEPDGRVMWKRDGRTFQCTGAGGHRHGSAIPVPHRSAPASRRRGIAAGLRAFRRLAVDLA